MKRLFYSIGLVSIFFQPTYAAVCCCDAPEAAAILALDALLVEALFDGGSGGKPIVRVLREVQATDSINTSKLRETIETSAEQLRDGEIAYKQQEQQLKFARDVDNKIPPIGFNTCASSNASLSGSDGVISTTTENGVADASRRMAFKSPKDMVEDVKNRVTKPVSAPYSGGMISRPGCVPIFDPEVTAFSTRTPIPVGWNCEGNENPRTVTKHAVAPAQAMLNDMLGHGQAPSIPVSDRKTPAGQVYEVLASKYNATMELITFTAQESLARLTPYIGNNIRASTLIEMSGVNLGTESNSWMDINYKTLSSRFDNPFDSEISYGVPAPDKPKPLAFNPAPNPAPAPAPNPTSNIGKKVKVSLAANSHEFDTLIVSAASSAGIDPFLQKAHIAAESTFDPKAFNSAGGGAGAAGLHQFRRAAASDYGLTAIPGITGYHPLDTRFDPTKSTQAGARFIRDNLRAKSVHGDVSREIMSYHDGRGAGYLVGKTCDDGKQCVISGGVATYVNRVLGFMEKFRQQGMSNIPPNLDPVPVFDPTDPLAYDTSNPTDFMEYTASLDEFKGKLQLETMRDIHTAQIIETGIMMEWYKIRQQRAMTNAIVHGAMQSIQGIRQ